MFHWVLHICVKLEFISFESNRKVALGDSVPASLKGHLIAGQPAVVAHDSSTVDGSAIDVVVHIAADVDVVAFVARLELATLLAADTLGGEGRDCSVPDKSRTWEVPMKGLSSRLIAAPCSIVLTQYWARRRSRTSASVPWPAKLKQEGKQKKT